MALRDTFTQVEASGRIELERPAILKLDFAGTGSVTLQLYSDKRDEWDDVETYTESSIDLILAVKTRKTQFWRLNCTARSADIGYEIED